MAYNNNQGGSRPISQTFTPISFPNATSKIMGSKLAISYFNQLLKISISKAVNNGGDNISFDYKNSKDVYLSYAKAKILRDLITKKLLTGEVDNVAIETNKGLIKVSNGKEYKSDTPVIAIIAVSNNNAAAEEYIYQTKGATYGGAYNYKSPGKYTSYMDDMFEINTFVMVLEQYYYASSYAIAASVMEANMYKHEGSKQLLRAIASKVGASTGYSRGGNSGKFQSKSNFLSSGSEEYVEDGSGEQMDLEQFNSNINDSIIPKEYETSTFDEIARGMED
jgi:hypothetical protein